MLAIIGVVAVATVLAAPSAQATHLGYVQLGHDNSSSTWTQITSSSDTALYLFGNRALYAVGNPSIGVHAWSYGDEAIRATAIWPAIGGTGTATNGVHGISGNPSASGVFGENVSTGFGVQGKSQGIALRGESTGSFGLGVSGENHQQGGVGVFGTANHLTGIGVYGSSSGTGVKAYSANGTALEAQGKVKFTGRSGRLTIPAGASSIQKCGLQLDNGVMIQSQLQTNRADTWVRATAPNVTTDCFTIYLNKPASANTSVAYVILG
jgi:hypothetical protein